MDDWAAGAEAGGCGAEAFCGEGAGAECASDIAGSADVGSYCIRRAALDVFATRADAGRGCAVAGGGERADAKDTVVKSASFANPFFFFTGNAGATLWRSVHRI